MVDAGARELARTQAHAGRGTLAPATCSTAATSFDHDSRTTTSPPTKSGHTRISDGDEIERTPRLIRIPLNGFRDF